MTSAYLEQLIAFGVMPKQLPVDELTQKLSSGDLFFMIDIAPDTSPAINPHHDPVPDPLYNTTFYYSASDAGRAFRLTHFVATLYHPNTDDILRCRTFHVIGETVIPTVREAKNLLQGRAVWKRFYPDSPIEYAAWIRLDFSRTNSEGSYPLVEYRAIHRRILKDMLGLYPIVELEDASNLRVILDAIHAGELVALHFREGRSAIRRKVIAYDPRQPLPTLHSPATVAPTLDLQILKEVVL
jgi:hypothetical protein